MGYHGGYIPGHSGTQFKNRKLFKAIKKLEKIGQFESTDANSLLRQNKPLGNYKEFNPRKQRLMKVLVYLPVLITTFGGLTICLFQLFSHY